MGRKTAEYNIIINALFELIGLYSAYYIYYYYYCINIYTNDRENLSLLWDVFERIVYFIVPIYAISLLYDALQIIYLSPRSVCGVQDRYGPMCVQHLSFL